MDGRIQAERLARLGAEGEALDELLAYNENVFDRSKALSVTVPLDDEPFVGIWSEWLEEARSEGVYATLARHLPPLSFPVAEGMKRSPGYVEAVGRGEPAAEQPEARPLELEHPESVELELYPSIAGRVPVITVRHRPDFVLLVQALAKRNEPVPIPESQGAAMVAGFANWERIHRLRSAWEATSEEERETTSWGEEFARIRPRKELYLDRFMILSDGPYSAVPAADLGLDDDTWRTASLTIRREHECTHYFTRRVYDSMRNHLLDELMADYCGLVAAIGRFRAEVFLRFLGLEPPPGGEAGAAPTVRPGGRINLYRGDPPLSDAAFAALTRLIAAVAANVEAFDRHTWPGGDGGDAHPRSVTERARMIQALSTTHLAELASDDAPELLGAALAAVGGPDR